MAKAAPPGKLQFPACCCGRGAGGVLPSVERGPLRPRLLRVLSHMWSFRLEVSVYKSIITGERLPRTGLLVLLLLLLLSRNPVANARGWGVV